jgi:hypothetical protein
MSANGVSSSPISREGKREGMVEEEIHQQNSTERLPNVKIKVR